MKVVPAYKCTEDIRTFLYLNQQNKYYENLFIDNWFDDKKLEVCTWSSVTVCFYTNDKLVGWLFLEINRPTNVINVNSFCVIDKQFTVSIFRAVFRIIKDRANKRVPKVTFGTLANSNADKIWRKLIKKYNGVVVGIRKNHCLDQQENYRDFVLFEIYNPKFKEIQ